MLRVDHPAAVLSWSEPAGIAARGTLVVVPGRGEQPTLYERFGARLAADGYRVHVVSEPTNDPAGTRALIEQALAAPGSPAPKVLVGSDTGGLFAAAFAAAFAATQLASGDQGAGPVDALVLAGLPVPDSAGSPGRAAGSWEAELESRTACPTHQGRLGGPGLRRGALYEPVPDGWFAAADLARVRVPILGLHGEADPVSPLAAARLRYQASPAAELVRISGGRHDALNDQTHRSAAATIVLFLERLRASPTLAPIAVRELAAAAAEAAAQAEAEEVPA
jgi:alpha-beta hydrolase superfamily lysophospholipase